MQQESLIRLVEASNDKSGNMDRWMSKLESSNWLGHVKMALGAACLVAQCIDKEEWSVLVHGSEGIDCTLTVTSLAQVILDPDCRTIRGLLMLIDKEWIQGGHPFTDRSAHSAYSNAKQRSEGPVFAVFLECLFQLLHQFPLSFEFMPSLLLELRNHAYASEFGTFLFNNMQERTRNKVRKKTISLWSYILSPAHFSKYLNTLYRRKNDVIWPSVAPQSLEFWEELYTPWLSSSAEVREHIREIEAESEKLRFIVSKLSKKVAEAQGEEFSISSSASSPENEHNSDENHLETPKILPNEAFYSVNDIEEKASDLDEVTSVQHEPISNDKTNSSSVGSFANGISGSTGADRNQPANATENLIDLGDFEPSSDNSALGLSTS